jgi:DNA-binding IclR family transcriptional regulator
METTKKASPVMSVRKAFELLEIILFQDISRSGVRLSDLAAAMKMPDNTARNLLKTMIDCGFAAQNAESRYIAGPKCAQIGALNKFSLPRIKEEIHAALLKFNEVIDEHVCFAVLVNGYRDVVSAVDSKNIIKAVFEGTSSVSVYDTATGRVLAAFAGAGEFAALLGRYGLPGRYWDGINDVETLREKLDRIKSDGHCEFMIRDLLTFAVPVLIPGSSVTGALGCYAPAYRWPEKKRGMIIEALRKTAGELAETLR